jgi:hypothetical protein
MKSTEHFKNTIKAYLDKRANEDALFAFNYFKTDKNIDDCITYILNTVQKSGCNGFDDDEIFSMAVHYYDEDNIDVGKPVSCNVVVNHHIELTAEEKDEARQKAILKVQEEAYSRMTKTPKKPQTKQITFDNQLNLFAV